MFTENLALKKETWQLHYPSSQKDAPFWTSDKAVMDSNRISRHWDDSARYQKIIKQQLSGE